MCKSLAEGGQRCTYADQVANVRRKARYKHRDDYDMEREATKAVRAWQAANPEIVRAHLPETQPFQASPNKKPIPEKLLSLFTAKAREAIKGLPDGERQAATKALYDAKKEWEASLTKDEDNAVHQYAMNFYEVVNSHLRRSGMAQLIKENPFYKDYLNGRVQGNIKALDEAIAKAPQPDEPRKLFRFFRVPAGVTPTEYIERYFKTGEGFKDRGYMSTTADPEFIMGHMYDRNKGTQNHGYIVMEIITRQGASLQSRENTRAGDIQSLENEVLLPRNMKLRIANSRPSQRFEFASDRRDLHNQYGNAGYSMSDTTYARWGKFKQGDRMNFPIIQMVDERLIDEN